MLDTSLVFVDTNVFVACNFDYQNKTLEAFARFAEHKTLQLVLTEITLLEIRRHLRRRVDEGFKALDVMRSDARILSFSQNPIFDLTRKVPNKAAVLAEFEDQLEKFLKRTNVVVVEIADAKAATVFKDYFEGRPPFGPGGKKDEFPDAFALASLEAWLDLTRRKAYVVGKDKLVAAYCEKREHLISLPSLEKVVELAVQKENDFRFQLFEKWLASKPEELNLTISDFFSELAFELTDVNGEAGRVEIREVIVISSGIIDLVGSEGTAVVTARVHFEIDVQYDNPEFTYYDREENNSIVFETVEKTLEREELLVFDIGVVFPDDLNDTDSIMVEDIGLAQNDAVIFIDVRQEYH